MLLEDPARAMYGVEIGAAAGLASGTVHPILARLEGLRWLESTYQVCELCDAYHERPRAAAGTGAASTTNGGLF